MPIQKTDRDSQWTLAQSGLKYILAEQATIRVDLNYGIYEGSDGNEIVVKGDIVTRGEATAAIRIVSSSTTLMIAESAHIKFNSVFSSGVVADGAGQHVENYGRLTGENIGLFGALWGSFENHGTIAAFTCVQYVMGGSQIENHGRMEGANGILIEANGSRVLNASGATIETIQYGIGFSGADGGGEIINKGVIRCPNLAIIDENAELHLVNHGKIFGDIYLGGGDDFVEMRGGTFRGTLDGGAGDDVYRVDIRGVHIVDTGTSANDTLFSTVSTRLGNGVDVLQLKSGRDIDGTGNEESNALFGNAGDNHLRGLGNGDLLFGGRGRDRLEGGDGADGFFFNIGDGVDTIADFEDGIDQIGSDVVNSEQDFLALSIRRHGADTVIDFGNGDRLIVEDIRPGDIDYIDFVRP